MCKYIAVNNWWRYQHYKERRPVWVKLHVTYLEDKKDWPADQRLIALLLMIVAANKDNRFTSSAAWLAEELGLPVASVRRSVAALLEDGFLRDADAPDSEQPKSATASSEESESASKEASAEAMPTRVSSPLLDLPIANEGIPKGSKPKKQKKEPKYPPELRAPIWSALTTAFGFEATSPPMKSLKGDIVNSLLDIGATADDVAARAKRYREKHPTWEFTMPSLLKWWDSLAAPVVDRPAWIASVARPEIRSLLEQHPNPYPDKPGWWWQVEPGPADFDVEPMPVERVASMLAERAA